MNLPHRLLIVLTLYLLGQAGYAGTNPELDRNPEPGQNLAYFPEDGAILTLNPPAFRWVPGKNWQAGKTIYIVEYSSELTFPNEKTYQLGPTPYHVAIPGTALSPGKWFWRYGINTTDKSTTWSRTRSFTVKAGTPEMPFPGSVTLCPTALTHPRLMITSGELPGLRQRAASGDLRDLTNKKIAAVKQFIGKPLCAEPEYLPKDQSYSLVYTNIYTRTRPDMFKMQDAAVAYLLSGNSECGAEAKRRVLHFFAWDPHGSTGLFNNDEPAMMMMLNGVRSYDWTYDLYTPEERTMIENSIKVRSEDFYLWLTTKPYDSNPYESHQSRAVAFLAEAAIILLPDNPAAVRYLDYVLKIYYGSFPAWGKEDGGWNEWPHYWSAYMGFAFDSLFAIRQALGIDLFRLPFFRNTPYYILYTTAPGSRMPFMGDGEPINHIATIMRSFAMIYQDPVLLDYVKRNRTSSTSMPGLLLRATESPTTPLPPLPQARSFPGIGLAAMHTDLTNLDNNVKLLFQANPYGGVSHGHNDQNCFTLEAFGEPLAIPSGYYNYYGSPHHFKWVQETKAACGITVDAGQGQPRGPQSAAMLTAFISGTEFDGAVGNASGSYGPLLSRAIREIVHIRPGLFVMRDDLAADRPRSFEYNLHAEQEMTMDQAKGEISIIQPRAGLNVRLFGSEPLLFSQTDRFETPPDAAARDAKMKTPNQYHFRAATENTKRKLNLISILQPYRHGDEQSLSKVAKLTGKGSTGVELISKDGSKTIVGFANPDYFGIAEIAQIRTDARVFAVKLTPSGAVSAWLALGATTLDWQGKTLHHSEKPENHTLELKPGQQ